ncbi:ABC transporter ATP-binding protein [Nonomuraea pusilla]|uniref:Oligopeptide/dipeptide ABC transporter, ATP-binding protein, C-terminal domain-containing protein n=1 Tax=Nonomuraea pusilla TaxID=46177 RepID=A0A1H7PAY1_9ACTN|nr:ABC transporter ATP-binding protein [Nonomuraea pusilla]SEL32588.1 oligopeptide/dipeptide ABC transporter, ATP-binding protein, C-terminal domain-containing protein [Nonomuraea pusilla]
MSLLTLEGFGLAVPYGRGRRTLVEQVDLTIGRGEAVGLVGESGSGKSMTARAVIGLTPPGARVTGRIVFDGAEVPSGRALRRLRAERIAMIFQDPRAHINPVRSVGDFLTEAMIHNLGTPVRQASARAVRLLKEVGIGDGERRLRQYPHELSGGLLQRVMIASVLAVEPDLVLADEPTTALDVTSQSEVMAILDELRRERGMAMLLITHDLELAAATCDRLAVMYAGRIVEDIDGEPRHPYTRGLMRSRPSLEEAVHRLPVIPGRPVAAFEAGEGCAFGPRCDLAEPRCRETRPPFVRGVACLRAEETA